MKTVNHWKDASTEEFTSAWERSILGCYGPRAPQVFVKGEGSRLWDRDGRSYLDLGGGIAVNCLGHSHPAIREALNRQAGELVHISNLYYHPWQLALAERLLFYVGQPGRMFFCNSGAEANEALFKLGRKKGSADGRYGIITFTNSFHGRTLAGVSATGNEKIKAGFDPLLPGFHHVPFNDLQAVEDAIDNQTVAIMLEGVQGEGGINVARPEFLLGLRKLADDKGLLILWDGVQCGHFRTGRFQSYERILEGVPGGEAFKPDAMSMAKSLGGGFPMGAVWIAEAHADVLGPGSHGTTYGGTPLACAAGLAVLDVIEKEGLMDHIREMGDYLVAKLEGLVRKGKGREVRGLGAMVGLQLADSHVAAELARELVGDGLLLIPAQGNALRFLPSLTVRRDEIDEGIALLENRL